MAKHGRWKVLAVMLVAGGALAGSKEALEKYPILAPVPARPVNQTSLRRLESASHQVRLAAEELMETSQGIVADGRIHSLTILRTELFVLDRCLRQLEAEMDALEAQGTSPG